ncbi:hypothetical protein [Gimesia sp.]|uniref:hypothetical protein n=1 Tax=Gimesia sp. TaxID=2024833 RepID=UPI003A905522
MRLKQQLEKRAVYFSRSVHEKISRLWQSFTFPSVKHRSRPVANQIELLEDRTLPSALFTQLFDLYGGNIAVTLSTGNVVISSPYADVGGTDTGAVYLFNGATGELISKIVGTHDYDHVGSGGVVELANGNFVINSPDWDNGSVEDAGAVTFGNGITGVSGIVSASNSLVGSSQDDSVGYGGVTVLTNGNYVVRSSEWDNGSVVNAGAITFGNGTTGITGTISASNSLVGSSEDDLVGGTLGGRLFNSVAALTNGNYVVSSPFWDNGSLVDAGAVTFGDGTTGITGFISASNSLVGATSDDQLGYSSLDQSTVTVLTNGNYVVSSPFWDNGSIVNAGAATFGDGTTGVTGLISTSNSLVGSSDYDSAGAGLTALTNGNYVVSSPSWNNGSVAGVGAVTFGNGTSGVVGYISASNSLIGDSFLDAVGSNVTALANGNYVVSSLGWSYGSVVNAGAITLGDGTTGTTGIVSVSNSLVGASDNDRVGSFGVTALTNGNYVVSSSEWDNGSVVNAGAVTFGNGTTGVTGLVSVSNSLVGSSENDRVGGNSYGTYESNSVIALTNGNYVVTSLEWDNGAVVDTGAVTFGDGTTGVTGLVSAKNSLVGSSENDRVGGDLYGKYYSVTALTNGNYVVSSPIWDHGSVVDAGAVTFGNGTSGVTGLVSEKNSLVGATDFNRVGYFGPEYSYNNQARYYGNVTALTNGSYVVSSRHWDNDSEVYRWALTFGDGNIGVSGILSAANSQLGVYPSKYIVVDDTNLTFLALGSGITRVYSQDEITYSLYMDDINDLILNENSSEQTVNLSGIGASGSSTNPMRITATSSNTSLIPDPVVTYASPNSTGSLTFTPGTDQTGKATITVTVEDGGLDNDLNTTEDNTTLLRTFGVTVATFSTGSFSEGDFIYSSNVDTATDILISYENGIITITDPENYLQAPAGATQVDLHTISFPASLISGGTIIVHAGMGDDSLTVDTSLAETGINVEYHGGGGAGIDALGLTGAAGSVEHRFDSNSSGDVKLDGTSTDFVTYDGLEPVNDLIFSNDRTFIFTGGTETILLSDDGDTSNGLSLIDSDTAGEILTFLNPTNSMIIKTTDGYGADHIQIEGLDSSFTSSLTVLAGNDDAVTYPTNTPYEVTVNQWLYKFIDPNPSAGNGFGDTVVPLSSGNVVITAPYDDAGGTDAGAVYLFNGATGELISTLLGTSDGDHVGSGVVTELANGNFVISSPDWDNGSVVDAGAVTFGNGTTGVSGSVSESNSLVGSTDNDQVGSGDYSVTALTNGNYVVTSWLWDNGSIVDAGAATFGNGTTGITGTISASNSLVGTSDYDYVGGEYGDITALANGNYVVGSWGWNNGSSVDAGAVTFGDGTTGVTGTISDSNSLVGSSDNDYVGYYVYALTNGNYVVSSWIWDNGSVVDAGAVTFGDGTTGITGLISASNSLVGVQDDDQVGDSLTVLTNGNYVVSSSFWDNGSVVNAGAVTFGDGTTGITGSVSVSNSLVGSSENDSVGGDKNFGSYGYVTALTNGNYVVSSPYWDNGSVVDAGAVTFGDGTTGITGLVSVSNSLVGSSENDQVGISFFAVTALSNGNYVVSSRNWDNGSVVDAGAVTFGDGTTGVTGTISTSNSLVGSSDNDQVGGYFGNVTALTNGNYVVSSTAWDNGSVVNAGAVTLGDGTTGVMGLISASNSLVGSSDNDSVGSYVTALANGNYVVSIPDWDKGSVVDAGAVTFGDGTTGVTGLISVDNSLIGSTSYDRVGLYETVTGLTNGNYVVLSPFWDNGSVVDAGALTLGNGDVGVSGELSGINSQLDSGFPGIVVDDTNRTFFEIINGEVRVYSQGEVSQPPTLDEIGDMIITENASEQTVNLTGIGTSGSEPKPLQVTATSSNTSLIPTPVVSYTSPDDTVGLTFTPVTGQSGTVTITVTVESGGLDGDLNTTEDNETIQQTFEVTVTSLVDFTRFIDPNPTADNGFGSTVTVLSTGNVVITSPYDDAGGTDAGAVYLYNGVTGELISTLIGSSDYDHVGQDGVTALANGNFVVTSSAWDNGSVTDAGAVSFGNGITGVSGVVSEANSLIGSTESDFTGSYVTTLSNGNYVVSSTSWNNGSILDAGAVTFGDGTTGVSGVVSSANSLVGSTESDRIGNYVTVLSNGNYVVRSTYWNNGSVEWAGAVTFGDGTTGVTGTISAINSLVGSTNYDSVGNAGVIALTNGNYVVSSSDWDNGSVVNAGAVTFGNGTTGVSGVVSAANSLVGSTTNDNVGSGNYFDTSTGVIALSNGNYVVRSGLWDNGYVLDAGAVTFGDGTTGVSGVVSAANSLVGSSQFDNVGRNGVTVLSNGNYVVQSDNWDNGSAIDAGAVTFGNGTTGVSGVVSATNSLVGSTDYNNVGSSGITELSNGNYVVSSIYWDNGTITNAGAVTFGDGTTGVSGVVSSSNSLVGSTDFDSVGNSGVTVLTNGNYVVASSDWDSGSIVNAGAVTFGDGTTGITGLISASNSLIGSTAYDYVGGYDGVTALTNGNYVVSSSNWDNGSIQEAGAVTFGNGTTGVSGVVSEVNSLVGSSDYDRVGYNLFGSAGVTALSNGGYLVSSPEWDNGSITNAGAATFGSGTTGVTGVISSTNSLIGSSENDNVGYYVTVLSNGNYVVTSPFWSNGTKISAGAVTFGNGTTGVTGEITALNSLVGSSEYDNLGYKGFGFGLFASTVTALSNGNYVVASPVWDNGTVTDAGAVTFGDGTTGVTGEVSAVNSVRGTTGNSNIADIVLDDINNTYYAIFLNEAKVWALSQSYILPSINLDEISDVIVNENSTEQTVSLTGITASGTGTNPLRVTATSSNTSLIPDPVVNYSSPDDTASLTFTPAAGQSGIVTITVTVEDGGLDGDLNTTGDNNTIQRTFNVTVTSLLLAQFINPDLPEFVDPNPSADNGFGDTVVALSTGNVVITSPYADIGGTDTGAVYLFNGATGELISTITGTSDGDQVGYGGITELANGNFVISSPYWDNGTILDAGAATFGNGITGVSGSVSVSNSLVGSTANDQVGGDNSYGDSPVTSLTNGNYVVSTAGWDNGSVVDAGAVTFGNGTTGVTGLISASNSLVGFSDNDQVGNHYGFSKVTALSNGNYVVRSSAWDNGTITDAGAVTFADGATGITGFVSSSNSLVGSSVNDQVGSRMTALTNGNYVVGSPHWKNDEGVSVGASTFGDGTTGITGTISSSNSLVGSSNGDQVGFDAFALTNGNYVVASVRWDNSTIVDAGAVTFGNGTTGVTGLVSASNSLVGSSDYDQVGGEFIYGYITVLTNGNYVIASPYWQNSEGMNTGAVTFGDGTTGVTGTISSSNSLVGSSDGDRVGSYVTELTNGNYVVTSPSWDNGSVVDAGAATFGNGITGISGSVTASNSLVGSSDYDEVGYEATALANGNYVVSSGNWDNGSVVNAGAVTFGDGTTGVSGIVSASNSLVGSTDYDQLGLYYNITALTNGNYLVTSSDWDNGTVVDAGAVTFGNGTTGVTGLVSASNSIVGSSEYDLVGSYGEITVLSNGNYVVSSSHWDNGSVVDAGAITFGDGHYGVNGEVSAGNSQIGLGAATIVVDDTNHNFFVISDGKVRVYSQGEVSRKLSLDEIGDIVVNVNASEQTVSLTGIVASGIGSNALRITAVSSNTSLIPDPVVNYSSPDDTGSLTFTPAAGQSGIVTITVTVEDGGLDGDLNTTGDNRTIQRTFDVTVTTLVDATRFLDPNPSADNGFGDTVTVLSTGNVVITAPRDDAGGTDAGAVYLFNGATGELISTLTGSSDYDYVGLNGVTTLTNGNYVVRSSLWSNDGIDFAGAVTFGNGTTGINGVVSAANSLVGSTSGDLVGISGVTALANGNYVVLSSEWDNGAATDAGAVTFGNGTTGVSGAVSASNSLVGSTSGDKLGGEAYNTSDVTALSNGNYVVRSAFWDNGTVTDAGAVTFGDGTTGVVGTISSVNSLVGSTTSDNLGLDGVTVLSNNNYVVNSSYWDNGSVTDAGAVTFGDGTAGVSGVVSAANSLVGSHDLDHVGAGGVTGLTNGNYIVSISGWDNGSATDAGAVTFGDGTTGVTGVVSATNSLVGSSSGDRVGTRVTQLSNSNYVVSSTSWDNGTVTDAGAVTFGDGTTGISGVVSATNSLVGSSSGDRVGGDAYGTSSVTVLSNGNYVVVSPEWDNGAITDVGAVTFGDGTTGVSGLVSAANSLVGSTSGDSAGLNGVTVLSNGNYVVSSAYWDNGAVTEVGAVTFGDGTIGISGVISEANSLIGSTSGDKVGNNRVTALSNGNYVVISSSWDNGTVTDAGAVTFGNGTTGISGAVSEANSLVGSTDYDQLGLYSDIILLTNGNYVVSSIYWDNGAVTDAGAVTFGNGTTGISGVVSASNSLVGSSDYDQVGGYGDVTVLTNGNYVVRSSVWDNGMITDAGAVTFGNGTTGVSGVVSETNSLVGSSSNDKVGYSKYYAYSIEHNGFYGLPAVTALANGNYVVSTPEWDNGTLTDAGAVTFGDGTTGVTGVISAANSVTGSESDSNIADIVIDSINNNYIVIFLNEGKVWALSQGAELASIALNEISDVNINENASEQTVDLTGIAASGFGGNPLRVTATSSNTSLILDPVVSYSSPNSTGSLTFIPVANQTGIATITVTVEDGGLDGDLNTTGDNNTIQRTFNVTVTTLIDVDLRVVDSPTAVDSNGETTSLPDHQSSISEWSTYWVEIWVKTDSTSSQGIFSANLDLSYHTQFTSATTIEYGSGFALNQQTGTVNDSAGIVENLYAETDLTDLGISKYLLFARIKFESLADDSVDLDILNQTIGPYDLGFTISSSQADVVSDNLVSTNVNSVESTSIWANPYDLNDDDILNYRDLILLVSVYGVTPSASDSDYAWVADLNQSNRVDYRDLILFVGNYGKSKLNGSEVNYPANYPEAWDQPLVVAPQASTQISVDQLTQSAAEETLEKAITTVSPTLSSSQISKVETVSIQIVDLENGTLGRATPGTIYLDVNAAGYGWFVDESPTDHSEFAFDSRLTLIALPDSEAAGHVDLWTVILHELGHLLGYEHAEEGLMEETLAPGVRKLAEWNEEADLFFASVQEETELNPF